EDAVHAAVQAGANSIGFVLCASPREISVAAARRLKDIVPDGIDVAAVFRHVDAAAIEKAEAIQANIIQGEGPTDLPMPDSLRRLVACRKENVPPGNDWILLDGPRPGSGRPTDFDVARQVASQRPIILAGGLTPDNVKEAIQRVRPAGVDVSSGVERRLGAKDIDLIKAFIQNVRETETNHDHDHRRP
ncbi:MAG: phosphoribosylanthranilate isomerase, partial [Myxococcota bacterium]